MAANTDLITRTSTGTTRPVPTTLTAILASGSSPGTATCNALTGWPTATAVAFCIYTTDTSNKKVVNSQTDWIGVVSGSTITGLTLVGGTNTGYSVGAVVEAAPIAEWGDRMARALLAQHNVDGTHAALTATSLSVSGTTALTGALTVNSYDGWITSPDTWTYASASSFTISGVDRTAQLPVGTKIKLTQTTAKYFYVTSTSFSTNTTVNITAGSDYTLANAAITAPTYSYDSTPQAFPGWFNYTPSWTAASVNPSLGNGTIIGRFQQVGKTAIFKMGLTLGSTTTKGTGGWRFSFPVTPFTPTADYDIMPFGTGHIVRQGVANIFAFPTFRAPTNTYYSIFVGNGASTGYMNEVDATTPQTWSTGDVLNITGTYETA